MWKRGMYTTAIAVFGAFFAVSAAAQPGAGRGMGPWWGEDADQRVERHIDFLVDRLDLSAEQVDQVRDILEAGHGEARSWFENNPDATRTDRRAFRKAHHEATHAAIGEILSEEQKERFEAIMERFKDRPGFGRHRRHDRALGHRHGHGRHHGFGPEYGVRGHHGHDRWDPGYGVGWHRLDRLARYLDLTPEQIGQIAEMRARHREEMQQELESLLSAEQRERLDDLRSRDRDSMEE